MLIISKVLFTRPGLLKRLLQNSKSSSILGRTSQRSFESISRRFPASRQSQIIPNPELGISSRMHQTKIGQFFKRKAPESEESESPEKKVPIKTPVKPKSDSPQKKEPLKTPVKPKSKSPQKKRSAKTPIKPKSESKGDSAAQKRKPQDESPQVDRKRKPETESESEEEVKPRAKNGNANKKPRRRIVQESSSDEEENETKVKSRSSSPAGSPSPKKSPLQEKRSAKSTPKATNGKAKAKPKSKPTPVKKSTPKTKGGKKTVESASKKKEESETAEEEEPKEEPKEEPEDEAVDAAPAKPVPAPIKGWDNEYNPGKAKYHPIDDACWGRGEKVPYLALAKTLEAIEATSGRLKFIEILANYFRSVIVLTPNDLVHSVYLCLNKLAPAYEGVELGIADMNIMKAIAQATGRTLDKIRKDAGAQGDLGLVAESSRSTQKTLFQSPPLTVSGVFAKLKEIASLSGNASQTKKISMITSMLVACKYSEARYLTRSLAGKLRIGLAEQSLLQALAQACFLTPPDQDMTDWPPKVLNAGKKLSPEKLKAAFDEEAFKLKTCFCECPNYELLVNAIIKDGTSNLAEYCKLSPGVPPRPMLAQPTKGVADVLQRFEGLKFTCEYKYDGERAQIHMLEDGSVRVYSRNQEDNTSKYPDIVGRFQACVKGKVTSCILDSEAVAWDIEKEQILPFQVLSTRKRKDANESEIKVQVQVFAFDLIYLNGEALVKEPLIRRRELLRENFGEIKGQFGFATSLDTDSMEEVQEFLEESIKGNCEGLMVKMLDVNASYELAKRSQKWLKLKKDYLDSGGDSLDLVVIGGFFGRGKRSGNYGGYLLACYNPEEEEYQSICKVGTGFTDEQLQQHAESLKDHVIPKPKPYYNFHQNLTPDHWFDAVKVWEVKCADLSLSPVHMAAAGIVDPERGISLRFPRFLRIRDDKNPEDATSSSQVADMYKNQEQVKNSTAAPKDDDDGFY